MHKPLVIIKAKEVLVFKGFYQSKLKVIEAPDNFETVFIDPREFIECDDTIS